MYPDIYTNEKLAQAHRQELLCETEQQRMLASLPGHGNRMAVRLELFLIVLGTSLKRLGRRMTPEQAFIAQERMTRPKQVRRRSSQQHPRLYREGLRGVT